MGYSRLPLPKTVGDVGPGGPIVTQMNALEELRKNQLANQYYGPNIQSEMANRNALTQQYNINNESLPEKNRLANAYQNMINQFYPQKTQADINSLNATTNKTNTMTPLEAKELSIKNEFGRQRELADINYKNMGGAGGGVGQKEEMFFQGLVGKDNPQLKPEQIYEASNALRLGKNQLSDGTKINPLSPASNTAWDRLVKGSNTAQGLNQQRFANTLDKLFYIADKNSDKAFEYSGVAGKSKQGFDVFTAQSGHLDPNYEAFNNFVNQDVPALVTEIVRTSGAHSTDSQKAMAIQQAMPINLRNNPKLAKSEWEELKKLYRNIAKTISSGPGQTRLETSNLGGSQQSTSNNDLSHLSDEELRKIAGI